MAGPRGYSSYRGKGAKWKIALAVLLVFVILAAVAVIRLQKYVVYDDSGHPRLELPSAAAPEKEQTAAQSGSEETNLTVQEPEKPADIYAFLLSETPLSENGWESEYQAHLLSSALPFNAAVYTAKDASGSVYFDSQSLPEGARKTESGTGGAIGTLMQQEGLYTIAKLACFRDGVAASADLEGRGLKNTGGYVFYDGNNDRWLDPGKPSARQYLCTLAGELAALGFDEILLTDVSYPTVGKIGKIDYGAAADGRPGSLSGNLAAFLTELREALKPYDMRISLELPLDAVTSSSQTERSGQALSVLAPLVDRIYAEPGDDAQTLELIYSNVSTASEKTLFVPELSKNSSLKVNGSRLVLE